MRNFGIHKNSAKNYGIPEFSNPKVELDLPLRFRKAGRVWCGGARETH